MKLLKICFLLLFLQGCYADKGDYDLVDYNKITSITSVSGRAVILGDTLKLTTSIVWKYPDRDTTAFSYEWKLENLTISRERNLAYLPTVSGMKMYHFYITENATGIVSRFSWQITVNSPFKAGYLMLTNKEGNSGLDLIKRVQAIGPGNVITYSYTHYKDLYKNQHPDVPLGQNPVSLVTKAYTSYNDDEVLVFQDDAVFLNGASMEKTILLREDFQGSVYPKSAKPVNYIDGNAMNFVLFDNGEVYWKRNAKLMGGIHDEQFIPVPMYFEGGGAFISRLIDNDVFKGSFVYMFDQQNKRFLSAYTTNGSNDYMGSKMYLVDATVPPAGFVSLNNMNGYKLMYSTDYSNGIYYMNIIKQEATGKYFYQTYKTAQKYTALEISEHFQEEFAGNDVINDQTVYYRTFSSSYLFFGTGSKLYFYDINTKRIKLYKDFGTGTITHIVGDANEGEIGIALNNGSFKICSLKNDILGENDPGVNGVLFETSGIGEIVDLKWKWGSYYDFIFRRYPV